MNFASAYAPWWELGLILTIATTGIVSVACLMDRWLKSAVLRRAVWQVALASVFVLAIVEVTGIGRIGAVWMRVARDSVADWSTTMANTVVVDAPAAMDTVTIAPPGGLSSNSLNSSPRLGAERSDLDRMTEAEAFPLQPTLQPVADWEQYDWAFHPVSSQSKSTASAVDLFSEDRAEDNSFAHLLASTTSAPRVPLPPGPSARVAAPVKPPPIWPGILWLTGTGMMGAYVLFGYLMLTVFRRQAKPFTDVDVRQRVDRLAHRLDIRRRVSVVQSSRLKTPVAFGTLGPTIALHGDLSDEFGEEQVDAILAHELAHLAAGDPAWHLAADLLTALLWWQPAVWLLRRRLQATSEMAADEATLILPAGPTHLAASLVEMGRRLSDRTRFGWIAMTGDGYRSNLGRRVGRLLKLDSCQPAEPRRGAATWIRYGIVLLLVFCMILGSAWFRPQVAFAEGESTMTKLKMTWSRSLAAVAATMVLGPLAGDAPADDRLPAEEQVQVSDEVQVVLMQEEGEEREERERGEAESEERETREREAREERREREAEQRAREEHEARERMEREQAEREREGAERERFMLQMERKRAELLERAEQLKQQIADLPDEADEQSQHLGRELDEIQHAARRVEQELAEARGGDLPRREGEAVEHPEELLRAMAREREELMELGRNVMRELEQFKRSGDEAAAREAAEKLERIKREVAGLEARAREFQARREGPGPHRPPGPPEEVERRMHHLRVAADNLRAAGLHEQAERLMREAEGIVRDSGRPDRPELPPVEHLERALHDMHRQMDEMRGQMEEMQRALRMLMERDRR